MPLGRDRNIFCPGDIIIYNCSIQSNSEDLHLTWRVTLSNGVEVYNTTHYPNTTDTARSDMSSQITSLLTDDGPGSIESIITLILPSPLQAGEVNVQCSIGDLENSSITISIETSGKANSQS